MATGNVRSMVEKFEQGFGSAVFESKKFSPVYGALLAPGTLAARKELLFRNASSDSDASGGSLAVTGVEPQSPPNNSGVNNAPDAVAKYDFANNANILGEPPYYVAVGDGYQRPYPAENGLGDREPTYNQIKEDGPVYTEAQDVEIDQGFIDNFSKNVGRANNPKFLNYLFKGVGGKGELKKESREQAVMKFAEAVSKFDKKDIAGVIESKMSKYFLDVEQYPKEQKSSDIRIGALLVAAALVNEDAEKSVFSREFHEKVADFLQGKTSKNLGIGKEFFEKVDSKIVNFAQQDNNYEELLGYDPAPNNGGYVEIGGYKEVGGDTPGVGYEGLLCPNSNEDVYVETAGGVAYKKTARNPSHEEEKFYSEFPDANHEESLPSSTFKRVSVAPLAKRGVGAESSTGKY